MTPLGRELRLVSFDLDDTLIDTEATAPARLSDALAKAAELVGALEAGERQRILSAVLAVDPVAVGRLPALLEHLGIPLRSPQAAEVRKAYNSRLTELVRLVDGAIATLEAVRGRYRTVIVTNGPLFLQEPKIARFQLDRFVDHVVISEAVGVHKPNPAIFEHACRLAGVAPAAALHVGDSLETDIAGAKAAGLLAVWLRPSRPPAMANPPAPDVVIERLGDLVPLLELLA